MLFGDADVLKEESFEDHGIECPKCLVRPLRVQSVSCPVLAAAVAHLLRLRCLATRSGRDAQREHQDGEGGCRRAVACWRSISMVLV